MTTERIEFGFSPCPNDTFAFHALVHGAVEVEGCRFEPWFADIEQLNSRAVGDDPLPLTKLSVGALAVVTDRYAVLPAGAALGRGVGPLLVVDPERAGAPTCLADLSGRRVAIPGERTTANLLLRLFAPADLQPVELRFDRIMPAVARGEVDAGLIIHESRFTYRDHGLAALADVGDLWERDTGLPLPLGVIAMRRDQFAERFAAVATGLRQSVERAFALPGESAAWVAEHAQEMSAEVCRRHIDLYVNEWSIELGDEGRRAVDALLARGRAAGLLPEGGSPWH